MGFFKKGFEIKFTNSGSYFSSQLIFADNYSKFRLRKTGINTNRDEGNDFESRIEWIGSMIGGAELISTLGSTKEVTHEK